MSGTGVPQVTAPIAAGTPAADTAIDQRCFVIGVTSIGSGSTGFLRSSPDMIAAAGYGDPVDTACGVIEQKGPSGAGIKIPCALLTVPATTPATYGNIDVTGVTGTATAAVDPTSLPYGTYQAALLVSTGGTLGTTGIAVRWALDRVGGPAYSNPVALGVATSFTIPHSNVKIDFGPTSTNAAYVALAVELRADTLAHLANVTAHDGADTSAAQVALAASSVPATVSTSTAVVNLVLAALVSHVVNITAHDGPDLVAHTALALLSAATNTATGIDLANALKAILNAHEAVSLTASTAGLMGATASIASIQTYTAAGNFLAGGVAAMDAQPRRIKITISGSGTPADMPDSVTITGFDYAGNAQTETALSLTGLGTVISTKAWKGTGLQLVFVAADGTAASFQVGYSNGGHNSADVTNVITSANANYGTLIAGDVIKVDTVGGAPLPADIFDGSTSPPTGALATLALSAETFGGIACDFQVNATMAASIKLGLDYMASRGKDVWCLNRVRTPNVGETETQWSAAVAADFFSFADFRQIQRAGYGLTTDAVTGRVYLRSTFGQTLAEALRVGRVVWPCSPHDRPLTGVRLSTTGGIDFGHDEGEKGTGAVLAAYSLGNRFACDFRDSKAPNPQSVYLSNPFTCYGSTDTVKNWPTLRVILAIKRVALQAAFLELGGIIAYNPADPAVLGSSPTLPDTSRNSLQGGILAALASQFSREIQNFNAADIDTGLVRIPTVVTVSGGNLVSIAASLNPKVFGYVIEIALPISIQE